MKIANIIYEEELYDHDPQSYINYYNGYDPNILLELPTLVVGWEFLKKIRIAVPQLNEANILNKTIIKNNFFWEFSFNENKSSHIDGIKDFSEDVPDIYFSSRYNYKIIDPVFYQIRNSEELFDILPKEINSYYIFENRMLYILSNHEIIGLDLEIYRFFKFNIDLILMKISTPETMQFNDISGDLYRKYYKKFPNFFHLKRYLVAILSN